VTNKNPKDPTWKTPFHWAAQNGFVKICHLIILYSDDKNPGNLMGITPLHVAASKGHLSICHLIIENMGEDKNPRELRQNNTPFHFAALNGHTSVCQLFLNHIDNPQPINSYGDTPFQWALKCRKLEVCELILQHIVDMVDNARLPSEEFPIQNF
jgi:ankyrin repeat protein